MITFGNKGDFSKTLDFLNNTSKNKITRILDKYGNEGVEILSKNTPLDSGVTSSSWYYKIETVKGKATISWFNSNVVNGVPIAIILQYGHGTQNGGYVAGRDYINPAMKPLFDKIANQVWKEVINK
jgi:hypothetical protein